KRSKDLQTAISPAQIPVLTGSQMVHQGAVMLLGEDADVADLGRYQRGENKVNQTIPATERNGCQGSFFRQLIGRSGIAFRKENTHCLRNHDGYLHKHSAAECRMGCLPTTGTPHQRLASGSIISLGRTICPFFTMAPRPTTAMPHSEESA